MINELFEECKSIIVDRGADYEDNATALKYSYLMADIISKEILDEDRNNKQT